MTTPRIGDTVHYRSHGSPVLNDGTQTYPDRCRAAIVTDTTDIPDIIIVCVLNPTGIHHDKVRHDTESITVNGAHGRPVIEQYTPGTWHHIH